MGGGESSLADKVMITAYGLFLSSLAISVLLMRKVDRKQNDIASAINRRAGLLLPLLIVLLFVPIFFLA